MLLYRKFSGVTQYCLYCKRIRKLYGKLDVFNGRVDVPLRGFWKLDPLERSCSGHKWVTA